MKVHAPPQKPVRYFDHDLGVELERPELAAEWILRTLEVLRVGLSKGGALPDDLTVTIRCDIYRELLREIQTTGLDGMTHLFGAALRIDERLSTWFEISWTSEEEKALQGLLDSWR